MLIILFLFIFIPTLRAQITPGPQAPRLIDTITIFHDAFTGVIIDSGHNVNASLKLDHKKYHDEGTFVYSRTYLGITMTWTGSWTVLKGDVKDENATVVELDGNNFFKDYYARRKDGNLQQLDTFLVEKKPVSGHILKKQ